MNFDNVTDRVNKAYVAMSLNQSTSASMCAPAETRRIPAALLDLDARMDVLYEQFAELTQRLFPVLVPEAPIAGKCADEKPHVQQCDLEIRLRVVERRVTDMTNWVMDLKNRLEL